MVPSVRRPSALFMATSSAFPAHQAAVKKGFARIPSFFTTEAQIVQHWPTRTRSFSTTMADTLRRPKKLIIACDGTWMNSDIGWTKGGWFDQGHPQNPSNVTRLVRALKPEDGNKHVQIAYYQSGIGTNWSSADKFLGGGLAMGLSENVREAYGFLVNNYHGSPDDPNSDRLFFIGFSRGAYTARSVAGMIGCLGLLEKPAMSHFYAIFEDFENAGHKDYEPQLPRHHSKFQIKVPARNINEYLKAYRDELRRLEMTRIVDVQAIGVFDTVGSLGVPVVPWLQRLGMPTTLHSYRFFDTGIDDHVKNAFQVLALDEHRSAFGPTVWSKRDGGTTNLKQIWIPGVHTNAGGGADDNGMCDISLAWMMDQLNGAGLEFDKEYIEEQVKATKADYETRFQMPWKWGQGRLGNSFKFPTSLAGSVTRSPLGYFVTDYDSGRPTDKKLTNTNEFVHACVRLRYHKGKTHDGRPYRSNALEKWKEPDALNNKYYWQHPQDETRRLPIAPMGEFEKRVLSYDKEAENFVENGPALGDRTA